MKDNKFVIPGIAVFLFAFLIAWGNATSSTTPFPVDFYEDGNSIAQRSGVNLISGTGITITGADDSGNQRVNYTVNSSMSVSDLPELAEGNFWVGDGTSTALARAMSGDVALDGLGATTIQPDSVALTTDTTGNYVKELVAGTAIDVGAAAEGGSTTVAWDSTEVNDTTWGDNTQSITHTFDVDGTNTAIEYDTGAINYQQAMNITTPGSDDYTLTPGGNVVMASPVAGISLSEIENLTANKTFVMAANDLTFTFTTPSDGFTLNATGAFSDHVLHVHQSTGNPGAGTALVHLSAEDSDVINLVVDHEGDNASFIATRYQLDRASTADNDNIVFPYYFDQDGGVTSQGELEFARRTVTALDVSENTEDAEYKISVIVGGAMVDVLKVGSQVTITGNLDFDTGTARDITNMRSIQGRTTAALNLRTGVGVGSTMLVQARDVDGAAWTTFLTLTAGNTPTMVAGGTLDMGNNTLSNIGIAGTDITPTSLTVGHRNGLDIGDGTDNDIDAITLNKATGAPRLWWDESDNEWQFDGEVNTTGKFAFGASGGNTEISSWNGALAFVTAGNEKIEARPGGTGGFEVSDAYIHLDEIAAPGAGSSNTVRIYAIVDGGTLTDLAAVFQDGTVDIFAQETTEATDAVVAAPDETVGSVVVVRPHPGTVQLVARIPGYGDWIISEKEFHAEETIGWTQGAAEALPVDWYVEATNDMNARLACGDDWDEVGKLCKGLVDLEADL